MTYKNDDLGKELKLHIPADLYIEMFSVGLDFSSENFVEIFLPLPQNFSEGLSIDEKRQLASAYFFSHERSHKKYFSHEIHLLHENSPDFFLGDKDWQSTDHILALTNYGVAWLLSTLSTREQLHIQSPAISLQCLSLSEDLEKSWSSQIDHATFRWGAQTMDKLHLTSVRDFDGTYRRETSAKSLTEGKILDIERNRHKYVLPRSNPLQQLFLFNLSDRGLKKMVDLTKKLTIGSSTPTNRERLRFQTHLSCKSASAPLIELCRKQLPNQIHILDLRSNSELWTNELNLEISAYINTKDRDHPQQPLESVTHRSILDANTMTASSFFEGTQFDALNATQARNPLYEHLLFRANLGKLRAPTREEYSSRFTILNQEGKMIFESSLFQE